MKILPSLSFILVASALSAQGVYKNADKPTDAICPRVEQDLDPKIAFGQASTATAGAVSMSRAGAIGQSTESGSAGVGASTGGAVGANTLEAYLHSGGHKYFPLGARKNVGKFTASDQHGKAVSIADLKGKIVLVGLWSVSCEPSAKMLMELSDLYPKREKFGFEILSVNFDENKPGEDRPGGWKLILPWMTKNRKFFEGSKMPLYLPGLGEQGAFQFMGIVNSLPALFVIDREGNLASINIGYEPDFVVNNLKRAIVEKPLGAPAPSTQPPPH